MDKTIRVSDEVLKILNSCKDQTVSMSAAISALLDKYEPTDFISRKRGMFLLQLDFASIDIPTFTPVNKILRISPDTYERLLSVKAYPDESFNMILFRVVTAVTTKPYILQLGKAHHVFTEKFKNYCFEAGIDIDGVVYTYDLLDIINLVQTEAEESKLIARYTGEVIRVWSEPFPEQFEYRNADRLFCPDKIAYDCYLCTADFENKVKRNFTFDIAMTKMKRNEQA
jgi:predicted CopG family antitoxin